MLTLTYSQKYALRIAITVTVVLIINYYFAFTEQGIMVATGFLVSQTTKGTSFRQGGFFLLTIVAALFVFSLLAVFFIERPLQLQAALAFIFIISSLLAWKSSPTFNKAQLRLLIFSILLWIVCLFPVHHYSVMQNQLIDLALGAGIAILGKHLIFPVKLGDEFRHDVTPVLRAVADYSTALINVFLTPHQDPNALTQKRENIEKILLSSSNNFPEWVYEVGFNPGLRSGFRFFLIHVERLTELYLSLDYLTAYHLDTVSLYDLIPLLVTTLKENQALLQEIIEYLEKKKITTTSAHLVEDILALETALKQITPTSLDLFDLSPDYLVLTAFAHTQKAIREILLQLGKALPV